MIFPYDELLLLNKIAIIGAFNDAGLLLWYKAVSIPT